MGKRQSDRRHFSWCTHFPPSPWNIFLIVVQRLKRKCWEASDHLCSSSPGERAAEVAKTENSNTSTQQGWRKGWWEEWTAKEKKNTLMNLTVWLEIWRLNLNISTPSPLFPLLNRAHCLPLPGVSNSPTGQCPPPPPPSLTRVDSFELLFFPGTAVL